MPMKIRRYKNHCLSSQCRCIQKMCEQFCILSVEYNLRNMKSSVKMIIVLVKERGMLKCFLRERKINSI